MSEKKIRKFFTTEEEAQIIDAIHQAELDTSGEIRVHIEEHCKAVAFDRGTEVFGTLEMHKTALRNGVLFYIATEDHKFAIVGDKGINAKVPAGFWDNIRDEMQAAFKRGDFVGGLSVGIAKSGNVLKEFFPYEEDDTNELPNEIST